MRKRFVLLSLLWLLAAAAAPAASATPLSIYGAWHCGNDACTWAAPRDMTEFDAKNRWLVDRGDGSGLPSVNLVVLSFVHPLRLLNKTTDAQTLNGIPRGMTPEVVNYFKSRNVRVMLSIGGITYTDAWNQALAANPTQFGLNAAEAAQRLGVGIEIDYEENTSPNLPGLQAFIDAYRSVLPYDASGSNHAARLTIDLAAGDRWLIALTRKATADWLNTTTPVLDYANAMVPSRQPNSASTATANWQEHIDGKAQYDPPIPPLAAAKFTGGLYIVTGQSPAPECVNFNNSLQKSTGSYVQNVATKTGLTNGMLGYMFWAAECPSTRRICTTPPNSCEGGVGAGAAAYNVPIPMPPLRQQ
ncbi:MAG TPA: hypothetical protein VER08_06845 [Pyrinomonadaceae bacterium]|nr:hypothetical protein [Pyrinomonadaceae bacterium]